MGNNYFSDTIFCTGWRNTQIGGNRVRKGPKGGVKIKVYKANGLCKRTFHKGDPFK